MEIDSVIAILRKGAKKLAPLLFKRKYSFVNGEKFIALYIEGDYCCYVTAQASTNPDKITITGTYKDIFLLNKIYLEKDQTINNKEWIDINNLYYLGDFRSGTTYYHTKELIVGILEKVNILEIVNTKTNESLFVCKSERDDYVNIEITKTEFDTLMLSFNFHVLVSLDDDYVWLKHMSYTTLIDILNARSNDVIIDDSLQFS